MTPKQRAAKAIAISQGYDDPDIDSLEYRDGVYVSKGYPIWKDFVGDADAALASIAEPSEAMVDAGFKAGQWFIGDLMLHKNIAIHIWKKMHAAMMAEKDTGE